MGTTYAEVTIRSTSNGQITAGRVVFGHEGAGQFIGVVALESAAPKVNTITRNMN